MFRKFINRLRASAARSVAPKREWTRATHTAYPESQSSEDGSWVVRMYAYEPFAWVVNGTRVTTEPVYPEPNVRHPNTYPQIGVDRSDLPIYDAPAYSVSAWAEHYRTRPEPVTLLTEIKGHEKTREQAKKAAAAQISRVIDSYRRLK